MQVDLEMIVAERIARDYLERQSADTEERGRRDPALLAQAMPLSAFGLNLKWDNKLVLALHKVLIGDSRRMAFEYAPFDLHASSVTPTLRGLEAKDCPELAKATWITEVHRNGYFHALCFLPTEEMAGVKRHSVSGIHRLFLSAFSAFAAELWSIPGLNARYRLRLRALRPHEIRLATRDKSPGLPTDPVSLILSGKLFAWSEPYGRRELVCDDHVRERDESMKSLDLDWISQLFNAFGAEYPEEPRA